MKTLVSAAGLGLFGLGLLSREAAAESMYNPTKSSVTTFNHKNFEKQVTLNREKGISVVQFYKASGKWNSFGGLLLIIS